MRNKTDKELEKAQKYADKLAEEKRKANKKLYRSSGRGQWSKKALKAIKESQAAMSIGAQLRTKATNAKIRKELETPNFFYYQTFPLVEALKKKAKKPVVIKGELGKVHDVELVLGGGALRDYTITKGELKPGKDEYNFVEARSLEGKVSKRLKRQAGEWVWKPKKRIPTRFNAKKLKEKHNALWTSIARQVAFDMANQKQIINSDKDRTCCPIGHLSLRFTETVSENAAFTAIVEMVKRGLL